MKASLFSVSDCEAALGEALVTHVSKYVTTDDNKHHPIYIQPRQPLATLPGLKMNQLKVIRNNRSYSNKNNHHTCTSSLQFSKPSQCADACQLLDRLDIPFNIPPPRTPTYADGTVTIPYYITPCISN